MAEKSTETVSTNVAANGHANIEDISEKLDKCSCLFIEYYQQILEERKLLDTLLDDAYLNMSKARSLLGCANLSMMQVPVENLKAKVKVNVDEVSHDDLLDKFDSLSIGIKVENNADKSEESKNLTSTTYASFPTWFGVLAPLSLKTSHKSFSKSLIHIKSICELQIKIQNLQAIYQDLLKEKKKLQKENI